MPNVLNTNLNVKRTFDPKNKADVEDFKNFLENNSWGKTGCPFKLEYPWVSLPDMIKDKIVRNLLGVKNVND